MEKPEAPKSRLFALEPLVRKLPEVEIPKRRVLFKERFLWCVFALVAFLVLTQVTLYGLTEERESYFGALRFVLASHAGSLVELGIGPIVTAGIIMQLLVGSKIIGLNLRESKDRALFTGVQKLLSIVIGVVQAAMFAFSGWYGPLTVHPIFIVAQLTIGVILILYLDELVSKYGFGSGISLFIAAGVSTEIVVRLFLPGEGILWGVLAGRETLILLSMVLATLAVFFIVVFAENMRVEIPIAYGRFGGMRGRYPIRFLYASVIPVILAMIVFTNVRIFAGMAPGPILGTVDENGVATGGLIYFLSPPTSIPEVMADPLRAVVYFAVLVGLCMGFAVLWIYMSGMGPRDIAEQLDRSGMLIPGFRRDVRVMEWVLGRYILPAAVLGGAFIGVISAAADFTGAIGGGTGILLTVGILYGLYEEIAKERVAEMYPALRRFFGE